VLSRPGSDALARAHARPLRAAELTAISAGRRLYGTGTISADATVNTIMFHTPSLETAELEALEQIGQRSFGICARAGVLYQQAADLLSELREEEPDGRPEPGPERPQLV
jgi:hypothetical protein